MERRADDPVALSARGSVDDAGEFPGIARRSGMGESHPSNRRGKAQNRGTRRHRLPAYFGLCTTEEMLEWIGQGLKSRAITFPDNHGPIVWPRYSLAALLDKA